MRSGLLVGGDRPVAEDDRALLRDRRLELLQPHRDLGREAAAEQAHGDLGRGVVGRVGAAEREVLERQPQRLGVCELPVEQVHGRRERRELGVVEVERRQEVVLLQQRVELLAREVVALRLERHAEGEQLAAVGVETAREGLVGHLGVALDSLFHVARRGRAPLGHQVRDERELAHELVGVRCHRRQESMRGTGTPRGRRGPDSGPSHSVMRRVAAKTPAGDARAPSLRCGHGIAPPDRSCAPPLLACCRCRRGCRCGRLGRRAPLPPRPIRRGGRRARG